MIFFPQKRRDLYGTIARLLGSSKIPLSEAFRSLADMEPNMFFRPVLMELAKASAMSTPLHSVLRSHPFFFPTHEVELISQAGNDRQLISTLQTLRKGDSTRLSQHLFAWIVIAACIAMVTSIFVFILVVIAPQFEGMFKDMLWGQPLPLLTQLVLSISHLLRFNYQIVVAGAILCGLLYYAFRRIGPAIWHDRSFRLLPSTQDHKLECDCLAFCQGMSIMLRNGKPVASAITDASNHAQTGALRYHLKNWLDILKKNEGLDFAVMRKHVKKGPLRLLQESIAQAKPDQLIEVFDDLVETFGERARLSSPFAPGGAFPLLFAFTIFGFALLVFSLFAPLLKLIELLG